MAVARAVVARAVFFLVVARPIAAIVIAPRGDVAVCVIRAIRVVPSLVLVIRRFDMVRVFVATRVATLASVRFVVSEIGVRDGEFCVRTAANAEKAQKAHSIKESIFPFIP